MVKRNGWGIAWLIALVPLVALASPPQLTREQLSILLMLWVMTVLPPLLPAETQWRWALPMLWYEVM